MMLTIFGLPPKTKYNEVKALIKQECNLIDFILDNLVDDGSTSKKVRIGLSDDNDCYRIIKNLDGFRMSATHVLKVIPVGKASQSYDQRSNYQNPARPDFPPQRSDYPAQPSKTYGSQGSAGPQRQFPDSRQNAPESRSFPPSRTDLGSTSSRPTPSFNQVRPEYQHGRQDAPSFQGRSDTSSSYRPDAGNFQVRPDTGSSYMGRDTRFEPGRPDNRPDVHSRPDLEMHRSQVPATQTSRMDIHQDRLGPRPTQGLPERPGMVDNRPQPWTGNMNANNSSFKEVPGSAPGNFNMPQRNMGFNEQSSIPQTPSFSSTRPPLDVPYGFPNKNSVPDISTTRPALRAVEIVDTPARPPQPQPYSNNKPITIMKDNFQGPSHYNISGHSIQPLSLGAQSQGSGPQPWASQATQPKPYDKPYDDRRFPADKRLETKPQTIEYDKRQPFDPRSGRNASPNRSFPEKFPDKSYLGTDRRTSPHGRLNAREPSPTHNPSARRVPSPIRRPGSPNRRPISPGRRQMPNDGTRRPISPGRRHISPNRRNPSPARHHISPNRRLISPNRRPMSPTANRRLVSPNRRVISPNRRPMSPSRRPISPNRRQMSPTRRVISPGRRQLADDRRDDRRMSPSDRRQPVPREDPARRYSPHKRASPSRRDDTQRPRFSPRRQIDSDKFMDTDKPKSIRPAYETMAPNQYSSGYRPNVHENIQYPRQERINPWEKDKDKTYRVMKKDEREGEAARSPARKSRSRSPVKDRFRRDSPSPRSPRSPRRSWALERRSPQRRRSPDQLRSPPPPPAWPDRQDRPDRPDRPNRIDRLDRPDRIDRQERPDRIDRPERTDRQDRSDRPDRIDRPERPDRIDRQDRSDRIDRPDRIDRNDHIDRPDRVDRPHPVDLPERPDRWPIESYRANIDRDFQDIYERAREFSKKAEELRKSAGEKRREEFESRRQEDQQRPRTSNDRPNIDYQRQEPQEKRSRFEKIEPNERRKPILPTSVKTKRDRATDEVVNKILERYDMKPDTAARVNEELKSVVSNIMYDMFGERDVSFIELVIKYQGKYTDKDEEKMVNDAIMNLPPTYRSGVKRKMQDESEVPAKMSRASPKMKEERKSSASRLSDQLRARPSPQLRAKLSPQLRARLSPQARARLSPQARARLSPQPRARLSPQPRAKLSPQPRSRLSPQPRARLSPQPKPRPSAAQPMPKPTLQPRTKLSASLKARPTTQLRTRTSISQFRTRTSISQLRTRPTMQKVRPPTRPEKVFPRKTGAEVPKRPASKTGSSEKIEKPSLEEDKKPEPKKDLPCSYYEVSPLMAKVIEQELQDVMIKIWQSFPDNPTEGGEKLVVEKFRSEAGDAIKNTLGLNISQRLLNIKNEIVVKLQFPSEPARSELPPFLRRHELHEFRRAARRPGACAANLSGFAQLDALLRAHRDDALMCGNLRVTVTPCYQFMKCPAKLRSVYDNNDISTPARITDKQTYSQANVASNTTVTAVKIEKDTDSIKEAKKDNTEKKDATETQKDTPKETPKEKVEIKKDVKVETEKVATQKAAVKVESAQKVIKKESAPIAVKKDADNTQNKEIKKELPKEIKTTPATVKREENKTTANVRKEEIKTAPANVKKEAVKATPAKKAEIPAKVVKKPAEAKLMKPIPRPKVSPVKHDSNKIEDDFDELDDHDILAMLSEGVVLDECSGSDED